MCSWVANSDTEQIERQFKISFPRQICRHAMFSLKKLQKVEQKWQQKNLERTSRYCDFKLNEVNAIPWSWCYPTKASKAATMPKRGNTGQKRQRSGAERSTNGNKIQDEIGTWPQVKSLRVQELMKVVTQGAGTEQQNNVPKLCWMHHSQHWIMPLKVRLQG